MLDPLSIPTPLLKPGERPKVEIVAIGPESRRGTIHLIAVLGRCLFASFWMRLRRRNDADASAKRLREAFESLGGLWIKVGQLLSLRTDMFSDATCRELSQLQHRALGFPFEEARERIEGELGRPLSTVFSHFAEQPIAAASVSQVHSARLRDGDVAVVVKVLRPHAEPMFRRDLRNISRMVWLLETLRIAPHVHWRKALWELEQMVDEELDFRYEAANMRRMRKSLREHGVYVAQVFLDYCSQGVLVSEFIPGVLMSDFITIGRNDPPRLQAWCEENWIKPVRLGKRLFQSAMRQLLEDNLFHADLHPGNIMILRDNQYALIDFGTIGTCPRSFLLTYKGSLAALAEKDFLRAADMTLRLAITPPKPGILDRLRTEMMHSYRQWEGRTHLHGLNYHERSLSAAGSHSGRIMFNYKVQLTWEFMRISRTWGTLDASLSFLIPDANYMRMFTTYFQQANARRAKPSRILAEIAQGVRRTVAVVEEYQDMLAPAVRKQIILAPSMVNSTERFMRFARTAFRIASNFLLVGVVIGILLMLHRYRPDLIQFENAFMRNLADDKLTSHEIWLLSIAAGIIAVFTIRRALRSAEKDG